MRHIAANLNGFETIPSIERMIREFNPNYPGRPTRRYPVRYLRYWLMRHLLESQHRRIGRPLRVLEVGIGYGKMLAFLGGHEIAPMRYALPAMIAQWDATSAQADPRTLERYSYSSFRKIDLDLPFEIPTGEYDALILLHVLEHLANPEVVMQRLLPALAPDGLVIGGSPTMPEFLANLHERQLRRKNRDNLHIAEIHKHLSVISPARLKRFARSQEMAVDLLAGTFIFRSSRSPMEDYPWWIRFNLAWGALFPALGGEIYFAFRKLRATIALGFSLAAATLGIEIAA